MTRNWGAVPLCEKGTNVRLISSFHFLIKESEDKAMAYLEG